MSGAEAPVVMIVGSDAHFIYLMQYYTKASGHQVVVAPFDKDVVALAKQKKPAVIVLESDLAELASQDLLQALKADRATDHFPVVVCSWQEEDSNVLAREADGYLQKPISYGRFLSVLEGLARASSMQ